MKVRMQHYAACARFGRRIEENAGGYSSRNGGAEIPVHGSRQRVDDSDSYTRQFAASLSVTAGKAERVPYRIATAVYRFGQLS